MAPRVGSEGVRPGTAAARWTALLATRADLVAAISETDDAVRITVERVLAARAGPPDEERREMLRGDVRRARLLLLAACAMLEDHDQLLDELDARAGGSASLFGGRADHLGTATDVTAAIALESIADALREKADPVSATAWVRALLHQVSPHPLPDLENRLARAFADTSMSLPGARPSLILSAVTKLDPRTLQNWAKRSAGRKIRQGKRERQR